MTEITNVINALIDVYLSGNEYFGKGRKIDEEENWNWVLGCDTMLRNDCMWTEE
jgi:hypothetical protein